MAKPPPRSRRPYLLSIRATVILTLSILTGAAAAGLTILAGHNLAEALLTGGAATGGAILLFNQIIADNRDHDP